MNNLELARLSIFKLKLRKEVVRKNIKYYTKQLEECIKSDISEEIRWRTERLLIKEENLLIDLENREKFKEVLPPFLFKCLFRKFPSK